MEATAANIEQHRVRWFARVGPCTEAPDGWLPRTETATGNPIRSLGYLTGDDADDDGNGWWSHRNDAGSLAEAQATAARVLARS